MIAAIIRWSVSNRFFVLLTTLIIIGGGLFTIKNTPIDALPDLSDVQVIIKTSYPGQAPQVVEDQVTYPLTTAMLSVPGAKTVRGYSFFGDSYVYIIFETSLSENVCITFAKFSAMSSNFTRAGKFVPHVVEMSTNFREFHKMYSRYLRRYTVTRLQSSR